MRMRENIVYLIFGLVVLIFGIVFCCNRREKDKQVSQEAQITTLGETKWCYLFISIAG